MSAPVERYAPCVKAKAGAPTPAAAHLEGVSMERAETGGWVTFADYADLLAERDGLKQVLIDVLNGATITEVTP